MDSQDSGGVAGREAAAEGKDPGGAAPVDVAAEGNDAGECGGGDPGELAVTEAGYDALGGMMKEDAFDINTTECGPDSRCALGYALGEEGDPYDEKAKNLFMYDVLLSMCCHSRGHVN